MTNIARRAGKAQCNLCGEQKSATQMGNHIAQELESVQRTQRWNEAVADLKSFLHLEIQHQHAKHFWMHMLVQHQTTLGQLDAFLRCVWLECCDHLSRFDFHGLTAASPSTKKPSLLEFDEDDDDCGDDDGEPLIDWGHRCHQSHPARHDRHPRVRLRLHHHAGHHQQPHHASRHGRQHPAHRPQRPRPVRRLRKGTSQYTHTHSRHDHRPGRTTTPEHAIRADLPNVRTTRGRTKNQPTARKNAQSATKTTTTPGHRSPS